MRRFYLLRITDISGVSGTGVIAEGVQLTGGKCIVRWYGEFGTTVVHDEGVASIEAIHGHGGATQVIFVDAQPSTKEQAQQLHKDDVESAKVWHYVVTPTFHQRALATDTTPELQRIIACARPREFGANPAFEYTFPNGQESPEFLELRRLEKVLFGIH